MHTWFVGNHPVGHYIYNIRNRTITHSHPNSASAPAATNPSGEKTFFMKSRISKGQADPQQGDEMGVEDFKWLSKEEVQREVSPGYWASVRNMLV
jgi:large subunit ribosomal protein L46